MVGGYQLSLPHLHRPPNGWGQRACIMWELQELSIGQGESDPPAMVVADRDGVIREWNPAATHMFGYSAAEAIGQTLDLIVPEEERADHWRSYRRVMATDIMNYSPDHILDVLGMRQDGSRVPLDAMLTATHDSSGRIIAVTATLREVCVAMP